MTTYVIAVKREQRERFRVEDVRDRVRAIAGVVIEDGTEGDIVRVSADATAFRRLVDAVGSWCHVEREIAHHPQR